jgi:PleD family two-component response regulator
VLIPDLTSLISKADERLYEAKELGRNRVVGYKKPEQDQNTAAA